MKKTKNPGDMDEDELKLWRAATRNMRAYTAKKAPIPSAAKRPPAAKRPRQPAPEDPSASFPLPASQGFDRSTRTKLERGKLEIEGRLDLHGMTQQEAFEALHAFIPTAAARGKRTVLLITGKGGVGAGGGILRRMLPQWLERPDLARYVVALTPAQPRDGGAGAFYVRLRKKK
jgi:DNA-nicking Smr family endonuclease